MNKLYRLKEWYTLPDAAKRLTVTLGEEVTVEDILQLAVEAKLSLSWYIRSACVQKVEYQTGILNPINNTYFADFVGVSGILTAEGAYQLDVSICGALKYHILDHVMGAGEQFISIDGFFVKNRVGDLLRVMERFTEEDLNHPLDKSYFSENNFFPSSAFPEINELGLQKQDIEAFERSLVTPSAEKPLGERERQTALKLVIGMAIQGYKYNPTAKRSSVPNEIFSDIALCGLNLDEDTVRTWLKEAASLIPPETLKDMGF